MQAIGDPSAPLIVCSPEELAAQRHARGFPDGHLVAEVQEYIAKFDQSAGYATAFLVPYQMETVDGVILLTSTCGSTRQLARNSATAREGGIISDPHWSYFDVWWCQGLVTLNWDHRSAVSRYAA